MSSSEPKRLGPWTTYERLGEGGNAVVWQAERDPAEGRVALKVVKTAKAGREPYRRFVREIQFLRQLENQSGVLPLVDAHLPDAPSADDRAWLAMPIARPISTALTGAALEAVVSAIAGIAETLTRLQAEHDLGHRDIKPGNLYELDGSSLIGDFGLIDAPDLEELTRTGRPLGPAHYTAYELIRDPAGANAHPADVYSLGKTLWVLATEQGFPPEGHQPAETRGFSIADLRPHPHASALDRLVDLMTRLHPEERPSKAQVARDLRAWSQLSAQPVVLDVTTVRDRFREKMERELAAEDLLDQRKEQAYAAVRRLQELTKPLNDALKSVHPRPETDVMDDTFSQNILKTLDHMGAPDVAWRWQRCSRIGSGPDHHRYTLRMGRGLELLVDGALILRSFIDVGYPMLSGTDYQWQAQPRTAPAGRVEAERMLEDGVAELTDSLREALEAFVQNMPT